MERTISNKLLGWKNTKGAFCENFTAQEFIYSGSGQSANFFKSALTFPYTYF